jgi:hypothetical protein
MSFDQLSRLITTTEAAAISGRTMGAIRAAVSNGTLVRHGRTETGRPLFLETDVRTWAKNSPSRPTPRSTGGSLARTLKVLAAVGPATPDEVALALELHVGNVRKYLRRLEQLGRARRQPDGQWTATASSITADTEQVEEVISA